MNLNIVGFATEDELLVDAMAVMTTNVSQVVLKALGIKLSGHMPKLEKKEYFFKNEDDGGIEMSIADESEGNSLSRLKFTAYVDGKSGIVWTLYLDRDQEWSVERAGPITSREFYNDLSDARKGWFIGFLLN